MKFASRIFTNPPCCGLILAVRNRIILCLKLSHTSVQLTLQLAENTSSRIGAIISLHHIWVALGPWCASQCAWSERLTAFLHVRRWRSWCDGCACISTHSWQQLKTHIQVLPEAAMMSCNVIMSSIGHCAFLLGMLCVSSIEVSQSFEYSGNSASSWRPTFAQVCLELRSRLSMFTWRILLWSLPAVLKIKSCILRQQNLTCCN